ncbi:MAG: transposase [Homavirus sp.]|uniref:Transposase n=1 Tax=Homavirus sp. TaxID=2487769 RepID=A0A3G5A4E5_9VIRU|nr:MAG: transposase [Homavirus sp.]
MSESTAKLKCIKHSLRKLATNKTFTKINDTVLRVNKIVIDVYNFIKLYVLYKYEQTNNIPKIDQSFILTVFKTVTENSNKSGRKTTKNIKLLNDLNIFYESHFKQVSSGKLDSKNLSHIMVYLSIQILTNIKNNIVLNFSKYIKNILRLFYENSNIPITNKELNKAVNKIICKKNKKFDYKKNSSFLPYMFVNYVKTFYTPIKKSKTLIEDIRNHPLNYLPYMIKINREIEEYNSKLTDENKNKLKKLYQVLPLRTNIVSKYIPIDTTIICDLLVDTGISEYYKGKTEKDIKDLWSLCFPGLYNKKNNHLIKTKKYRFDNLIYTDGVGVSIIQISNTIKTKKDKFIAKKQKKLKNEFLYIDELSGTELTNIKNNYTLLGVDPGKRFIVHMIDKEGKKIKYTSLQRRHECLHKANRKKINNIKTENIIKKETELSKVNSKSSFVKSFTEYLIIKYKINSDLFDFYNAELFRKLKWKSYIQTQRSEMAFVNKIRKTFESDNKKVCLMYGNWSQTKQQANYFPTPGIGFKRKLSKYFKVITIDEFRTSMLCHSCESETEQKFSRKNPRPYKDNIVKVHSLLHCKNGDCNKFWDRDVNGSLNILKLAEHYLEYKTRKYNFRRDIKKDEILPIIPAV